jgi:hypothetical protein
MSLRASAEGVKHSEGPQISFQHRFRSGALCTLTVDLASVKAGKFRPTLVWSGRPPSKKHELIAWTVSVFATVANRAQASIRFSFWHEPGRSETWDCHPGEKPRRIASKDEPCRNLASAIMAAAIGQVAVQTQSERKAEAEEC